jgi:DNA mismatch repair protein MutL
MGRIHRLPVSVVNRIAAGEVVERPASVVKELLENALDASPSRIDVALEQGGVALVRVVDDGLGIEPDDLPLAVTAHATSKLRVAEDLERIDTLGFRGEALASIGEVARLVVRSRPRDAAGTTPAGASITVNGGRIGDVVPDAGAPGTTVEVHQLFGNVPARRAFLRTPQTEWSHASEAFVRTALAHPGVAFTLSHNGRRVHDLPATTSWRRRISDCFGNDLGDRLLDVEADDGEIGLGGLMGHPQDDVAAGRLQHLFVAGRPFRDRAILHAVQEGYRGLLLGGRHPVIFLRFDMPPEMVDVNVHPAKMEVRFRDPQRLYRLVLAALRERLLKTDLGTRLTPPASVDAGAARWPTATEGMGAPAGAARLAEPASTPGLWAAAETGSAVARAGVVDPAWECVPGTPTGAGGARRAVQMHDRYIVVESGDGIEVIDQHALHERVLYERLKRDVGSGGLEVQRLLVPERVELDPAGLELVDAHLDVLRRAGMEIAPFGGVTVIVTAKPALVGRTPAREIVREILDRLAANASGGGDPGLLVDEVLHGLACRAAIKAGDPLSQAEVDALVRDRDDVPDAHHCPHGRPTSLTLSRRDLDRQFRRT